MKCERCNINNATHHYKKNINGVITEKFLCASCASEENMSFKVFTGPVFPPISFAPFAVASPAEKARCGKCGTTLDEFNETAYLGCAYCYDELRLYLEPIIKKLHGGTQHNGKSPKIKTKEDGGKTAERVRLVKMMERAISEEEFEDAARIRDLIRKIDSEGEK